MLCQLFLTTISFIGAVHALQCIISSKHSMNGQIGGSSEGKHVCNDSTKYCVKIQSEYIINGDRLKTITRGCDEKRFGFPKGTFCTSEGCRNRHHSDGFVKSNVYRADSRICCCSRNYCNSSVQKSSLSALWASVVILLLFQCML